MVTGRRPTVVVTTVNRPTAAITAMARGAREAGFAMIVVGDVQTPVGFALEGARFLSLAAQRASGSAYADACPVRHYARKNLGYLGAIADGATVIVDTDDDNAPAAGFFAAPVRRRRAARVDAGGWVNVYRYFGAGGAWPRGLPLSEVLVEPPGWDGLPAADCDCPIQQGLADGDPDIDAIQRLTRPAPIRFRRDRRVALGAGSWCPFNSQNTRWWPDAYPLLYLPACCSFRMTDIWRSFVAQRIAWANGWHILFHEATVRQERNAHDLMRDFAQEVPGYLHNARVAAALDAVHVPPGTAAMPEAMRGCYRAIVGLGVLPADELRLLDLWLAALAQR